MLCILKKKNDISIFQKVIIFRARLIACLIATEIEPSGSGLNSSQDCSLVDFDSGQVVPGLIQFRTKF